MYRLLACCFVFLAPALAAQSSPYIPLDHPLLPMAEYLIGRGDIADPSPMRRPFRRSDLLAAIEAAGLDPATRSGQIAANLVREFTDRPEKHWVRVAPRAGLDLDSRGRRDFFHPAGDGGVRFYADAAWEGRFGNFLLATRPAAENRLKTDPEWSGRSFQNRKNQAYRFVDAYMAAQFDHVRIHYGQTARNWGPVGSLGLSIADYGFPRTDIGIDVDFRDFQLSIVGAQLTPMVAPGGETRSRYFLAHRLNVRLTRRLNMAIWETGVLSNENQSFDPTFKNPLILLSFPIQLGVDDDRNTMIGGDIAWRPADRILLEGQAMIDDKWRLKDDPDGTGEVAHPGRWGLSGAVTAALGSGASWRTSLAAISSLAYRTIDSTQSFVDRGVGIGPHFTDQIRIGTSVAIPIRDRWLVTPDVTWLIQGEGRIDTPFPANEELRDTDEILIGQSANTLRLGLSVSGGDRRFQISGTGGWFHTANSDHIAGRSRNRLEARLRMTVGFSRSGPVR